MTVVDPDVPIETPTHVIIAAAIDSEANGRLISASLALTKLRERYEALAPNSLPADERTWRDYAAKHLPFGADRADELIGRLVHRGGPLRCSACGAESVCCCSCGTPYSPTQRWASPSAPVPATAQPALARAMAAIQASPAGKSDRAIAREIGVGNKTVSRARQQLAKAARPDTADDTRQRKE